MWKAVVSWSTPDDIKLTSASRVENAKVWRQYKVHRTRSAHIRNDADVLNKVAEHLKLRQLEIKTLLSAPQESIRQNIPVANQPGTPREPDYVRVNVHDMENLDTHRPRKPETQRSNSAQAALKQRSSSDQAA